MTAWLLSIAGIVVVGVLVELLLTDSHMSKFVRSIYGFFILLVIVTPLPGFLRGIETGGIGIDYDWELVGIINTQSIESARHRAERALQGAGISGVILVIQADETSPSFRINRVFINAGAASSVNPNITLRTEIIRIITATLNIDEGRIVYHA